jgi:hypothetical protein
MELDEDGVPCGMGNESTGWIKFLATRCATGF